jgi:hypothetical protein
MFQETPNSQIHQQYKYTIASPLQIGLPYSQDLAPQQILPVQIPEKTSEGKEVFGDYNRQLKSLHDFNLRNLTSIVRKYVCTAEVDHVLCTESITTLGNKM